MSLSGGQRQRLALARAIAARPAVLLLDDPLSALDTRTEEIVTARLREVLEGTTTLIVAHRTSTVALADRVALLDGGKVVAVGTHVDRSEEHTSELQSRGHLVCRRLLEQQEHQAKRKKLVEQISLGTGRPDKLLSLTRGGGLFGQPCLRCQLH